MYFRELYELRKRETELEIDRQIEEQLPQVIDEAVEEITDQLLKDLGDLNFTIKL